MQITALGGHSSARGALQKALLNQIRFDHILDGVGTLADGGGYVFQADRAAAEFVQNGF